MKKRTISILLALCLTLALMPTEAMALGPDSAEMENAFMEAEPVETEMPGTAAEPAETGTLDTGTENTEDNISEAQLYATGNPYPVDGGYIYFDPGSGEIIDCDENVTRADIPAQIGGVSVTGIHAWAFEGCSGLSSVTIPEGITSIGNNAFYECSGLTSVTIPESVTVIGSNAFYGCNGLTSAGPIDDGHDYTYRFGWKTSIPSCAFYECSGLTSVTIPGSITSIGNLAFYGCSGLTTAGPIGDGHDYAYQFGWKTSIPAWAFYKCSSLVSITLPEGITSIGNGAFSDCSNLSRVTIPKSVNSMGYSVFYGCSSLTSVTIPEGVTTIGSDTFCGCKSLTSVTIPESVTYIRNAAFKDCSSLITAGPIDDGYNYNYKFGWKTFIPSSAFEDCSGLTSVTIPKSVTSIRVSAFEGCNSLSDVYYPGSNADWNAISISTYGNEPLTSATIHYNSAGATTPSGVQNGVSPEISRLYMTDFTPNHACIARGSLAFSFTFNKNVVKKEGYFKIRQNIGGSGTDVIGIPILGPNVTVNGNLVTVSVPESDALVGGGFYYITIDSGSFASTDGTLFYGISDPYQWEFQIEADPAPAEVTLKWEQKGVIWKSNDYSKPPIPDGTDEQYASLLRQWSGGSFTQAEVRQMLDWPVYFPVTDKNGSPVLLFDKSTTVRQVIEDLVFLQHLQPYVEKLDRDLTGIGNFNQGLHLNAMWQERDIYKNVLGWYPQISRFIGSRNENSNFFYASAAPAAYLAMKEALGKTGTLSTVLRADFDNSLMADSLKSLEGYADYTEFKQKAEEIKWVYSGSKAVYTAITDGGKGIVSFGVDLTKQFFKDTGMGGKSGFLSDLSEAWSIAKEGKSAFALCMTLGSSIGMFPMVMDFANKSFAKIDDSVKAFYFIGDYYIYDKYPKIYDIVYDDQTCMPEYNIYEILEQASAEYEHTNDDPILYNWMYYLSRITEEARRNDCKTMRYDLVNYILLLKYAGSVNIAERQQSLVTYLADERNKQATTGISVSCPVAIKLYDQSNNLVAQLSSNDQTIQSCEYGTLYLLGENNETKYFLLNSDEYRVEIVPYLDSSMESKMDVLITNTGVDGSQSSVYYEDVSLDGVSSISTVTSITGAGNLQVTGTNGTSSVAPEENIPITQILLAAPTEMAAGTTAQADAQIYPSVATDQTVTWQCSNENVLTEAPDGTIQALSEGQAVITALSVDGTVSASATVNVYTPAEGVSVDTTALQLRVGDECALTARAVGFPTHAVSWRSNDIGIASVDENGVVHGVSDGATTLTAEIDGQTAEVAVTVRDYPVNVTLYQSDADTMQLKVDLSNASSVSEFNGDIYAVLYKNNQMLEIWRVCSTLSGGESITRYYPLDRLEKGAEYLAATFVLDANGTPQQVKTEAIIWAD